MDLTTLKEKHWEDLERILLSMASEETRPHRLKILHDIFKSTMRLAKESPGTLNLKIVSTVLKELRFSFKMFSTHRETLKITMFGSARVPPGTPLYKFAKRFAQEAVARHYMIITGGGPGIMAAGNEGATHQSSYGLNIRLPAEQSANQFIDPKQKLINYKYFFTRKLFLVKEAAAFAFFPGGFGTFDEAFEVLTLLQTGKTTLIPVVLVEPKNFGFWTSVVKMLRKDVLGHGFISEKDFSLFKVFHEAGPAIDYIEKFYRGYHSMRHVNDELSVRLQRPLSADALGQINKKFKGLATNGGGFRLSGPLPEESNEPELASLPRLVFPFERHDFGELRRLIDFINDHAV